MSLGFMPKLNQSIETHTAQHFVRRPETLEGRFGTSAGDAKGSE